MKKKKEEGGGKKVMVFGLVVLVFFLIIAYFKSWDGKSDFVVASLGEKELHILSFSPARGVVSWYLIPEEISLLVPGGYGWYPVSSLKGLIEQEKKENLLEDLLFLNFGLVVNDGILGSFSTTDKVGDLLKSSKMGLMDRLKIRFFTDRNYNTGLKKIEGGLLELEGGRVVVDKDRWLGNWVRDLADAQLVGEGLGVEILNGGVGGGGALKVGRILSMMGLDVVSIANTEEDEGDCRVEYRKEVLDSRSLFKLREVLSEKLDFEEKSELDTDFLIVLKEGCFLDIDE